MKKFIFGWAGLVFILMLASCEDFLELDPVSNGIAVGNAAGDSILYKTGAEVEAASLALMPISRMNIISWITT